MANLALLCRTATTFSRNGDIDEEALRQYLQRFVDAKVGVYLCSGGSGEGHALTPDELRRVYTIGVAVCGGKVAVNANPPEQNTARATRDHTLLAIDAGVEVVNIYGPAMLHGFRPTDAELIAFFDISLSSIRHPVALAPNPVIGYTLKAELIASVCRKHHQVVAVNLPNLGDKYLIDLKDMIARDIEYYVPLTGTPHTFTLGAAGIIGGELNLVPKTFRRYVDLFESGNTDELALVYADLERFCQYMTNPKWYPTPARGIKMAMQALKLPGGEGGLREPYLMPAADVFQEFTEGLLRLRVPEIDEAARAAGLSIPA